jgi:hypothetical protein
MHSDAVDIQKSSPLSPQVPRTLPEDNLARPLWADVHVCFGGGKHWFYILSKGRKLPRGYESPEGWEGKKHIWNHEKY